MKLTKAFMRLGAIIGFSWYGISELALGFSYRNLFNHGINAAILSISLLLLIISFEEDETLSKS